VVKCSCWWLTVVSVHYCTVCCSYCCMTVVTSAGTADGHRPGTTHMLVDVRCHVSVIHPALFVCKIVISLLRLITLVVIVIIIILLTLLFILRGTDGEGDTRVRGIELKSPRCSRKAGCRPDFSCLSSAVAHLFSHLEACCTVSTVLQQQTGWEL